MTNIFEVDLGKSMLYGTITAAIVIAILMAISPVMAYTLDATLTNPHPGSVSTTKVKYDMTNIQISDLPKELKATQATLTDPVIMVFSDSLGYLGNVQYKTPDGGTNLASTVITPHIKKILTEGDTTTVTIGTKILGIEGKMILKGSLEKAGTGTIHIEGIRDPTTD